METFKKRYIIKSQSDLDIIEGYQSNVNPKKVPLSHIVDWYFIPTEIQCGLSNCHQWHQQGFVVELTNGDKTNVGHICGSIYSNFETEKNTFSDKFLRPYLIEAIQKGIIRIKDLMPDLTSLNGEAISLSNQKTSFRDIFPEISKELFRRSHNKKTLVTESVARSSHQVDELMAANPFQKRESLRFEEVNKGTLNGLELFSYNYQEKICNDLVKKSKEFIALEITVNSKTSELVKWEAWLKYFDETYTEAMDAVSKAKLFFNAPNYNLMGYLSGSKSEIVKLKNLKTSSFEDPTVKIDMKQKLLPGKRADRKINKRLMHYANIK